MSKKDKVQHLRNVPKLRFKEFKDDIKKGKLEEFGYFYYGKGVPKSSIEKNGITPCIRYGELYSTYCENIQIIKSYTNIPTNDLKLSTGGEVLIPRVGEEPLDFANCSYLPISNVAIGEMISVYNTKENGLFITYFINGKLKKEFARVVEGGNVSNLYFRYLERLKVSIPSIEEQDKIVSYLSAINQKIFLLEKKLEYLKLFKRGAINEIFYNVEKCQKFQMTLKFNVETGSKNNQDKVIGGKYPFFVRSNKIEKIDNYSYDEEAILIPGDGKVGKIFHYINGKFEVHQRVYKITFKDLTYSTKFLLYYLQYKFEKHALSFSAKATVDSLRMVVFNKFYIPNLSYNNQMKIAKNFTNLDNKIQFTYNNIKNLKQFKKGLLQQMFV